MLLQATGQVVIGDEEQDLLRLGEDVARFSDGGHLGMEMGLHMREEDEEDDEGMRLAMDEDRLTEGEEEEDEDEDEEADEEDAMTDDEPALEVFIHDPAVMASLIMLLPMQAFFESSAPAVVLLHVTADWLMATGLWPQAASNLVPSSRSTLRSFGWYC